MATASAARELLASRDDVWALVSEPFHLPDWWPAYTGVRPDRRGLVEGARWTVVRAPKPGLLTRAAAESVIVITRVAPSAELAWVETASGLAARLVLEPASGDRTRASVAVDVSWWRLRLDGSHALPARALDRLYELCQTAAAL